MPRGDSYQLQGQQGGVVLAGTSTQGQFRWIQVINDAVFDDLVSTNIENAQSDLVGITIPAGVGIGGSFTNISLSAGVVIAYYA